MRFLNPQWRKPCTLLVGKVRLLKKVGVTQGAVWKWVRGLKKVSPVHAVAVSNAVNGVVKPHELRPDLPTLFPHPGNEV
ncbi:YdaS family helix-turn-helix protein [Citrobacter amalonaticus]|nr:YdaS family helix-turn-helix protein [Citrobacter amalonaticus]